MECQVLPRVIMPTGIYSAAQYGLIKVLREGRAMLRDLLDTTARRTIAVPRAIPEETRRDLRGGPSHGRRMFIRQCIVPKGVQMRPA